MSSLQFHRKLTFGLLFAEASRAAMSIRYSLLPYWYTLFYKASMVGDPTIRPLFYEFPDDDTLAEADRQFLVGDAILVTPVLDQGATNVSGVFPGTEVWYDWYTYEPRQPSGNVTVNAPLGYIPVHIRAGSILPMQVHSSSLFLLISGTRLYYDRLQTKSLECTRSFELDRRSLG